MNQINPVTSREEIYRSIYQVLRKRGLHRDQIAPNARFSRDLGLSASDVAHLVMVLEGLFDLQFPHEAVNDLTNINALLRCLHTHLSYPQPTSCQTR